MRVKAKIYPLDSAVDPSGKFFYGVQPSAKFPHDTCIGGGETKNIAMLALVHSLSLLSKDDFIDL